MLLKLTSKDLQMLEGKEGKAVQFAMKIIVRMAEIQRASQLISISNAHIDGCIYIGPANLHFAEYLVSLGGKVSVPTTMNAISIDKRRWKDQGVDEGWAKLAERLADAYVKMGAKPTYTCAPYQLPETPAKGDHIAWAESNAVVYANSVLGARTNRYGDLMDICAAITGRVPLSGYHIDEKRKATVLIELKDISEVDSLFYPVLGYLTGQLVNGEVPLIDGISHTPTSDDLKAFGAAAATSGSVGMFHMTGITPEAKTREEALMFKAPTSHHRVTRTDLKKVWKHLTSSNDKHVDLITVGSPHFSYEECEQLVKLIEKEDTYAKTDFLITTSSYVYEKARKEGLVEKIEKFGVRFLTDTCLCMIQTPIIPEQCQTLMTNSAKYAHYAPGLVDKTIYFGSLEDCVKSAISGKPTIQLPKWLKE
jgi:cis-L-3-hydroxyproline dehydratase